MKMASTVIEIWLYCSNEPLEDFQAKFEEAYMAAAWSDWSTSHPNGQKLMLLQYIYMYSKAPELLAA